MGEPLISVVIPAYNHVCYIEQAVDSVLTQKYSRLELVVVDDGSTDGTRAKLAEIVRRSGDRRLRLLTQANQGAHAAINNGLLHTHGEYLSILNSDDYFQPDRLAALLDTARTRKSELVFSLVEYV